jgi:hypothetical protein
MEMKRVIKTTAKWLVRIVVWQVFSVALLALLISLTTWLAIDDDRMLSGFLSNYCFDGKTRPYFWFVLVLYVLSAALVGWLMFRIVKCNMAIRDSRLD